jgi:hypothetical protein
MEAGNFKASLRSISLRDSEGRVMVKRPDSWYSTKSAGQQLDSWGIEICDPVAGTQTTTRMFTDEGKARRDAIPSLPAPMAYVRHWRTREECSCPGRKPPLPFEDIQPGKHISVEDLGIDRIAGVQAHGYRIQRLDDDGIVMEGNYTEVWRSGELRRRCRGEVRSPTRLLNTAKK